MRTANVLGCFLLGVVCLGGKFARADTIVYTNSNDNVVEAIDDLLIDGTLYDVTFGFYTTSLDLTFEGDTAGATTAASDIGAALNTSTAAYIEIPGTGSSNLFTVNTGSDVSGYSGVTWTSYGDVGNWQPLVGALGIGVAQFEALPSPVPEPPLAPVVLFGFGAIVLVENRRRRRSSSERDVQASSLESC